MKAFFFLSHCPVRRGRSTRSTCGWESRYSLQNGLFFVVVFSPTGREWNELASSHDRAAPGTISALRIHELAARPPKLKLGPHADVSYPTVWCPFARAVLICTPLPSIVAVFSWHSSHSHSIGF